MQDVFIVGSKGIPANYGGYETFVDKLTEGRSSTEIRYHVACAVDDPSDVGEFEYNGARCFKVLRRPIGPAKAVLYDIDALEQCIQYIKDNDIEHPIVYVLACRIGPFFKKYVKQIHQLGGYVFINPDGHEWKRAKWPAPVRLYWKVSEAEMVQAADLVVCDSKNIERYVQDEYAVFSPRTTFIAYGADVSRSTLSDDNPDWTKWLGNHGLTPDGYYLVVGRFVPENNYETMIREFMASDSPRDFAIVTGVDDKFLAELEKRTGFRSDPRIKFVGTVYDQELLKKIRENAHGYLHGHEVGGTNPSLLEALASTRLNLLLDVGFNREVAEGSALYWTKAEGSLAILLAEADRMSKAEVAVLDTDSTRRVKEAYSWRSIADKYENLFLGKFASCASK